MDGDASRGFSGGGLPPCPMVAPTRRRPFVAPHPRPTPYSSQERPSPGGGGKNGLPPRLPNEQPRLGPHALTFTEPHARHRTPPAPQHHQRHVYEVAGDFSPNHWMPDDYSEPRASSAAGRGRGYFTTILTQEADDDLEVLRQQDATPSTGGKGSSKRGSNYTNLEDIQLCKSWIHISNDPIIGNNQPGKTYWERIRNDFHSNRDFESDRTPNSLEHRFGIILKECMKFQGYYEEVERRHPSGIPYKEHLLEAQARSLNRHLKATRGQPSPRAQPQEGSEQDDESTAQGQESSSVPYAKKARPPGRKQSKEKLKKNEGDDEYKDMMQNLMVMKTEEHKMKKERWEKDMMLEQRRIEMEEQRL
ncbi:unnamed protein product [Miscanthus lutarioriparius]|uniref:No apical meristem-associated C-terminal domain-containing protein n=1 Tax=Miscanthus lutarioriparius TaxID=422564 RepID=A0A811P7E8_9POAL|nr:unnamed protein product [Miscanthus lutarioriparius]